MKKYKICLDDKSFIIADENYQITISFMLMNKTITIKEYLENIDKYKKYYMFDKIGKNLVKRTFTVEETDLDYQIGCRIKFAKDIQIGDLVLGENGEPKEVKELHSGEDEMFEIECDGKTFTVNGGHILVLVDKDTGEHLEMPVNIFMHMDKEFQSHWVMEKVVSNK